jgi:uncharacterized protein (DUF58 family)
MRLSAALHERFVTWALRIRPPEPSPVVLSQRRVYVLPTRAGLGYAAALLVMLIGAINYNLSLGYALTFTLAGLGIVAILHTFRNLVRLRIAPGRSKPVFAGESAEFRLLLQGEGDRRQIRLWLPNDHAVVVDVLGGASTEACLRLPATQRGWLALPRVGLETRYPLGLVRTWAYCAPDFRCLVYPRPAPHAPPLPWSAGDSGGNRSGRLGSDDFAGLRGHQPADSPRHVAWKAAARLGPDAALMTKQFAGAASARVWLDWDDLPAGAALEDRISILTRWALDAHADGLSWGLRLPGSTLAPNCGQEHLHAALTALALHDQA